MEPKETKTGRTGQGNASGRSSPGSKLKTEASAKKASGAKLKSEKTAQASVGEKLRHEKAVFTDEATKGVKDGMSHGRKTPRGSHASTLISDSIHAKIDRESDDNAGTDAMNRSSQLAEHTAQDGSNAFSRWRQKQAIKKEYAAAKTGQATGSAAASGGAASAKGAGKAAKETKKASEKVAEFVSEHWHGLLIGGGILIVIMLIAGSIGSCSVMFQGGTNVVIDTSYTAEDADILGAEADYCASSGRSIPAMTSTTSRRSRSVIILMNWRRI